MYVGILRVHDASRCAPLRKILKAPVTAPKKISVPLPAKKHRCLSISVRQRCFTQPPCGCAVFWRLAKAFQFFEASAGGLLNRGFQRQIDLDLRSLARRA